VRCVVVGLAETGLAVTRALRAGGDEVVVIEDAPAATDQYAARAAAVRDAGAELIEAPEGARTRALVAGADLVVPSPLVRPGHPAIVAARDVGVAVRSEIDVAGARAPVPMVAVTGTNGKTTVTTMTVAMLEASGVHAIAAGNIGRPLIDAVGDRASVIVAEVSSFQLAFTPTFRPSVAVVLAVTPDHLDWHGSFEHYVAAKARIVEHQRAGDLVIFDADDPCATSIAAQGSARRVGVSRRADAHDCFRVEGTKLVYPDGRELAPLDIMPRTLLHDRTNALAASAAALEVGATLAGVRSALATYTTMPHRVALVGEAYGVRWYDDSKATNPDATLSAVGSFDSVVLLAGGRNKDLDLSVLTSVAARLRGVVAFGEAGAEVAAAFAGTTTPVVRVASMREAVRAARGLARPGDAVVLSPACASFDAYPGYAARGDDFAAEVRAQTTQEQTPR